MRNYFSKDMLRERIKLLLLSLMAMITVFLLHMPQHLPTTVGKLADKYELGIKKIEYHQSETLIKEHEVSPEESVQLLEWVKDVKVYQPVYPRPYRDTEIERGNHIELRFSSDTGRVSGTFAVSEAGKLDSVKHFFIRIQKSIRRYMNI